MLSPNYTIFGDLGENGRPSLATLLAFLLTYLTADEAGHLAIVLILGFKHLKEVPREWFGAKNAKCSHSNKRESVGHIIKFVVSSKLFFL